MTIRVAAWLVPSLVLHGALFMGLHTHAATVAGEDPLTGRLEAVEFVAIGDRGGGRIGNDLQIGDAPEPAAAPTKIFRRAKRSRLPSAETVDIEVVDGSKPSAETSSTTDVGDGDLEAPGSSDGIEGSIGGGSTLSGSAGSDPDATMAGTGRGGQGVDRRTALRAWLREVQREVNTIATRDYPERAVRMKLEGRLKLGITIAADGRITRVVLRASSGHAVLDDAAKRSVQSLRIPPPPEALRWHEREIVLPLRYALD